MQLKSSRNSPSYHFCQHLTTRTGLLLPLNYPSQGMFMPPLRAIFPRWNRVWLPWHPSHFYLPCQISWTFDFQHFRKSKCSVDAPRHQGPLNPWTPSPLKQVANGCCTKIVQAILLASSTSQIIQGNTAAIQPICLIWSLHLWIPTSCCPYSPNSYLAKTLRT